MDKVPRRTRTDRGAYTGEGDVNEWFNGVGDLFVTRNVTPATRDMRKLTVLALKTADELGTSDMLDLREEIKCRAAKARLIYDGDMIDSALRRAIGIRGKSL